MTNARLTANAGLAMWPTSPLEGANEMDDGVPSAKAAAMNTTISATLMKVDTFWNVLARSMPRRCTSAIDQTSASASASGGTPGTTPAK